MHQKAFFLCAMVGGWIFAGCGSAGEEVEKPAQVEETGGDALKLNGMLAKIAVGGYPRSVVTRDFNGDGKLDVAVIACDSMLGDWADCRVLFVRGESVGKFDKPVLLPLGVLRTYKDLEAADFDGDGILDLAAFAGPSPPGLAFWRGMGDGTFAEPVETPIEQYGGWYFYPEHLQAGLAGGEWITSVFIEGACCPSIVYRVSGQGFEPVGPIGEYARAAGDFNEDGRIDLVTSGIRLSNGDGTYQAALPLPQPKYEYGEIAAADFDGDGRVDLLKLADSSPGYEDYTPYLEVLPGNGDATFLDPIGWGPEKVMNYQFSRLRVVDFDGNGAKDLQWLGGVLLGDGKGGFVTYVAQDEILDLADIDGNHATDVALGDGFNVVFIAGPDFIKD